MKITLPNRLDFKKEQRGTSLIEVLLAVVTLSGLAFLLSNIPNSINLVTKSQHLSLVREVATKVIEDKRQIAFSNLTNDSSVITDSRLSLLPQGNGNVLVEDCNIQICHNGESVKHLVVTINWKEGAKNEQVKMETLISQK